MTNQEIKNITSESLRDWFKKEKWVRISTSGNIAGPCGTSKNKKNPDRCLPKAKAQSLSKAERAATARKKKAAGKKGKTVVANTKKAKVKREAKEQWPQGTESRHQEYIFKLLKVGSDRAEYSVTDIETGEQKGTVVFNTVDQLHDYARDLIKPQGGRQSSHFGTSETANPQDGKAAPYGSGYKPIKKMKKETKEAPAGHYFTKSGNLVKGRMTRDAKERGARKSDPKDKMRSKVPKVTQYSEMTKEDLRNLIVGTIAELKNEDTIMEKDDRCTRIAKRKYDTWPSAYASGAVVRCRKGEIWKGVSEEVNHSETEIKIGDYQTKHYHMCPGAKSLYQDIEDKVDDMDLAVRTAKLQDALFALEMTALEDGATEADLDAAQLIADQIMAMAKMMGLEKEHNYIQGHVDKIKGAIE